MKRLIGILFIVLLMPGCMKPPAKTVMTTVDNKPVVAWDRDADGVADLNDAGEVDVIAGSEILQYTEGLDTFAPTILQTVGGLIGIPLLVGLGTVWRKYKFGRIFGNTVMTVQAARIRLKKAGLTKALEILDETLGTQTLETTKAVRDIKEKLRAKSVS